MKGRTQTRRGRWLRVVLVVTVGIVVHALGGSAQAAPAATAATGPATLAGFTSQRVPVFFRISRDGRLLLASGIAIEATCTSGVNILVPDAFDQVPIAADGRLRASLTTPPTTQNGGTYSGTDVLRARLDGAHSKLTGTWRLKVHISMASGQAVDCDSGPVHFSATS